jgi:hypothetical protein
MMRAPDNAPQLEEIELLRRIRACRIRETEVSVCVKKIGGNYRPLSQGHQEIRQRFSFWVNDLADVGIGWSFLRRCDGQGSLEERELGG